jgi:ABC-type glycerol-3-phosphate transport system permease component
MPILSNIQRRTVTGRVLLGAFYVVLIFGACGMVYPFLLMVAGSFKTAVDLHEVDIVPRFLTDREALFRKYCEQRYGKIPEFMAATRSQNSTGQWLYSYKNLALPESSERMICDWEQFLGEARGRWPSYYWSLGHVHALRGISELTYQYIQSLKEAFPHAPRIEFEVALTSEGWQSQNYRMPQGSYGEVYRKFRNRLSPRYFYPVSVEGSYAAEFLTAAYGNGPDGAVRLDQDFGTNYRSPLEAELPPSIPAGHKERELWERFVRDYLSPRFIHYDAALLPAYRAFLEGKYSDIAALNHAYGTSSAQWTEVEFPTPSQMQESRLNDLTAFQRNLPSLDGLHIQSPDFEWRKWLDQKYGGDLEALNQAWGTHYVMWGRIQMPLLAYDGVQLDRHKESILWDYLTRNYKFAWDQIVGNSNGLKNTLLFCFLNILTALLVNPLAAYALSRFQPRWGTAALFIMMATMAFPAEVTQIPSFLLLRELGWLNTFAALVIPSAASGYSIFLLKGFFDSLSQDLYEAASLDGCGEVRAFLVITVPLSLPILAVVALSAFTAAYGSFMFALLVCQKESMWTMMVYLYQMQQNYDSPIIFASLTIAAIPTLLVFIACQNVIMKGIVVPIEK